MNNFESKRFLLMTVDPVHVGTGGMRLGRVDNSIVREPGTHLPKIPGSALHGAIRQYAAYRYKKKKCAGQGGHCGNDSCPICYTFGFVKAEDSNGQKAHSGVVSIGDARLLLFPVYSAAGPVWVTSPAALEDFGISGQDVSEGKAKWHGLTDQKHLNLGWLMVEKENGGLNLNGKLTTIQKPVRDRIVLISDRLFSQVVNSNLEVRTSVSIDPETGAAEERALFTYEAIPRATILWLDAIVDYYRREGFPETEKQCKIEAQEKDGRKIKVYSDNQGDPLPSKWETSSDVITAGLEWAEHLGIGGMGTRGFGRIRKIGEVQL